MRWLVETLDLFQAYTIVKLYLYYYNIKKAPFQEPFFVAIYLKTKLLLLKAPFVYGEGGHFNGKEEA